MTSGKWLGAVLIIVSGLVLAGYGGYFFAQEFFDSPDVPVAIKIAVPAMVVGIVILAAIAIADRWRSRKKETFTEVEY